MILRIGRFTLLMSIFISIVSCGNENTNDNLEVKDGLIKDYYSNNALKSEINYKNGKKEGLCKYYRKDETLEIKSYYKNGLKNGESFWYGKNGTSLESRNYWVDGEAFGSSEWYFENGQLDTYNSFDFIGETFFVIKWDEEGNQIKYEGLVFSPQIGLTELEPKVGDEIEIRVAVATPPETKTIIKIGMLGEEKQKMKIMDYSVTYPVIFKSTGTHTFVTIGELYDLQGELLQRDSIATDINVAK